MCAVRPDLRLRGQTVSRETAKQLEAYVRLLEDWQTRMNLVSPSTLAAAWTRHIDDSLQLLDYVPATARQWIDLGSGAGFPGLVVAVAVPEMTVTLVESRAKKCAFLGAVVEELGLGHRVAIDNRRIEEMPDRAFDIISARALASLPQLFDWGHRFQASHSLWVLPKGRSVEGELADARRDYRFGHALKPSRTDADARIVLAWQVERRRGRNRA